MFSAKVGDNVRIYLHQTKGVIFKSGKNKDKVVSFKGKIKEYTKDSVVLKGRFMWNGFSDPRRLGKYRILDRNKKHPIRFVEHKKFFLEDIMRIMVTD